LREEKFRYSKLFFFDNNLSKSVSSKQ